MPDANVAILMVTYNAPLWSTLALQSLRRTRGEYTVNVVDNHSRLPGQTFLGANFLSGAIDRLTMLDTNTLFAEGNNRAAQLSNSGATHYLLLNPDVVIMRSDWLQTLLANHKTGITAFGAVKGNPIDRADGYCLLIDRLVWETVGALDEKFAWYWSVTGLQARTLKLGYSVQAIQSHGKWIRHIGGRSGSAWVGAAGMDTTLAEVSSWFEGLPPVRII